MATTTTANGVETGRRAASVLGGNWLLWLGLIVMALLPVIGGKTGLISNYTSLQLSLMIVYAIAVLGLNLLTGFNGQISLGHGAFFAVGAYLFGLPALRLEGHYLALATFALAISVPQMLKYHHLEDFTHGVQGINLIKPDAPFGLPLSGDQWMYLVVLIVAVVMFWIARNLLDSRTGRALTAIRDHTMAASTMGINVSQYKAVTFGISALYTGIA